MKGLWLSKAWISEKARDLQFLYGALSGRARLAHTCPDFFNYIKGERAYRSPGDHHSPPLCEHQRSTGIQYRCVIGFQGDCNI